jgi:hypothetical protein
MALFSHHVALPLSRSIHKITDGHSTLCSLYIRQLILIVQHLASRSCIGEFQPHVVVCNRTHDYPTTIF